MKKTGTILAITLFALTGCGGNKPSTDDLITVDVTASYPKKELILQDFMDVEYIPLETNDEFLCQGIVQDIGKDIIAVKNRVNDGDIFIFDRTGKAIRKINRKGRSREEYANISKIILDEDNSEMFVNDYFASKIVVYDLGGEFKRSFSHKDSTGYHDIYSFDRGNLICHASDWAADRQVFMIVSKQDGRVTEEISIPFEKKLSIMLRLRDEASGVTYTAGPDMYPIIPYFDSRILVEPSSDTVYSYLPDHNMIPFITRTPSI
ncbi:MAG: 6-bladed beta-propeller, partial [Tannerella sp.]|nr:6-bladed beta-propeller [Tannerella sp.]